MNASPGPQLPESAAFTGPIRVALIGYGFAGKTFHAPLIRSIAGFELNVVGSSNPPAVYADLPHTTSVLPPLAAATHPEIDLVVIATPNAQHAPLATAALNAGKHVVIDKPFTLTLDEARKLTDLAASKYALLSVFQNRRWDADFLAIRQLIANNTLGEILEYESHFDRFRPTVKNRWREQPIPGAGLWFDLGPHLIDQALQLFGLPDAVTASLVAQRENAMIDDWAHVLLTYGRRRVILHCDALTAGGVPRFAIHGTRGTWIKYGLDQQEPQLLSGMIPGAPGWGVDPQLPTLYTGGSGEPNDPPVATRLPVPPGDYREYYSAIRDALLHNTPNPVTPAQAIAVMAILETAVRSATEGRTMPLRLTHQELAAWD